MKNISIETINPLDHLQKVSELLKQLNPEMEEAYLKELTQQMTSYNNYTCFGLFQNNKLIGIASGWSTVRIYCGKHLELDNVIIDQNLQSNGLGAYFLSEIEKLTLQNKYQAIGLNSYTSNSRSHKFYYNQGFKILGFHFEK
ncbi:MAG: GNAT family N-acetyltransferase [Flavobacteriales bacterium]|nr:GNAT family N-acetyltransferase [Flavobacteriales bacterium]